MAERPPTLHHGGMTRTVTRAAVAAVAALAVMVAAVGAGCSTEESTTTGATAPPPAGAGAVPPTPPATTDTGTAGPGTTPGTTPAATELATVFLVRDQVVAPVGRTVAEPADVEAALRALLGRPSAQEADWGYGTEIPAGTELLGVEVADSVATVDLSAAFTSGGGSLSMQARVAQVVFTATGFDGVEAVSFAIDGEPVEAIGGEGVLVDEPKGRDDFPDVTPAILVESPLPGAEVTSPLTVTGESATFEGTVQLSVVDGDGAEVHRGFFTSTGANGVWGPFRETVTFADAVPGLGAVVLWEQDASGEAPDPRLHLVEIPVRMG